MKRSDKTIRMGSRRLISASIRRRLFRNVATIACFAFISGIVLSAGFLAAGAEMGVQAGMDRFGADMMVIPLDPSARNSGFFMTGQPSDLYFDSTMLNDIKTSPGVVRVSPQVYVGTLPKVSWNDYKVLVMGFDPATDFTISQLLTSKLAHPLQNVEVIVGNVIKAEIGSQITIYDQSYTVAGKLAKTGFSTDTSVFLNYDQTNEMATELAGTANATGMKPGQISAILAKVDKTLGVDQVLYWVTSLNPGVLAFPMSALSKQVTNQLAVTTQTLYMTVISVIVVSLPLVALIATMSASERRREIGLLRAMGAAKSYVFRLFFLEAVVLALIGGLTGVIGASAVLALFSGSISQSLNITFLWPSLEMVISEISLAILIAVLLAGIAAVWPAYRASVMEPYDAIRRGQN